MPRGNAAQYKVIYKGSDEDFIIFVDSPEDLEKWKTDRTIPLAHVVSGFKIMISHKHGAQGIMDGASKATLENEFGTSKEDECLIKILEKGNLQSTEAAERSSGTNDSKGGRVAH